MSRDRSQLTFAVLAVITALLASNVGCNALDFVPLASAEKTISEVFKTGNSPRIIVDTFNGNVDISQGADDEVVVEVTKRARGFDQAAAEAGLNQIQVSIVQKDNTIEISARRLDRSGNSGAAVVIAVPAAARLDLKSSNGAIICEDVHGGVEATTSNGKIEVLQGRGLVKVATSNGAINIEADDAVVDAHTSNGRVAFDGTLADAEHRFKTSNGKIELTLPADSRFRFAGSTSNGGIQCEFPIQSDGKARRSKLNGTVGENPACSITASTSNGQIAMHKASAVKP